MREGNNERICDGLSWSAREGTVNKKVKSFSERAARASGVAGPGATADRLQTSLVIGFQPAANPVRLPQLPRAEAPAAVVALPAGPPPGTGPRARL